MLTTIDERPDTATLESHAAEVPAELFSAVWEGSLLASALRNYRFEPDGGADRDAGASDRAGAL